MAERTDKPTASPIPPPEASTKGDVQDRRAGNRYPFTASAEICEPRSNIRVTGRCSDLGSGGCYVDTVSPFPAGSTVKIRIEHEHREFEASAVVAYAHVRMGMGLSFTEMKREHQAVLWAWISGLSGQPVAEVPDARAEAVTAPAGLQPEIPARAAEANVRLVVYKLIKLLVRNRAITEDEETELLRHLLR
jgi:hypothetical protein